MATPVEQIKDRLSIIDVVGSYVVLQKAGKSYKGKSPFTNERTPSFFVSPERGMYYCFSSGKGGDMFTFIQEMEGVDFKGALKLLAERAGVELVAVDPKARDDRERLFALLEDATLFFVHALGRAPEVRTYLESRGVKKETSESWRVGYAPQGWRNLKEYLEKKGYTEDLILKSGLLKKAEQKGAGYDVFRDRIMFPIVDASGRVVGFSGRTFSQDPAAPKYVNSPETELYQKSQVLFGYHKAKQGIRTYDFSLVVEGQFDLVLAHQAGYTNTVALSGTALALPQIELLQRLSNRVVLALDSDKAGVSSVKRSATLMLKRGMDVKVARILGGKDPADLVREDPKLLKEAVGHATHVVEFLLAVIKSETPDERSYKLRVREEVLPFISLMPNRIDQEHFEQVVAEALKVSGEAIHHEVARIGAQTDAVTQLEEKRAPAHVRPVPKRAEDLMQHLLGILLWQESEETPRIDIPRLRQALESILGRDSMQDLLDWPETKKNEAVFKAEGVYTNEQGSLVPELNRLLGELKELELKRKLLRATHDLKEAERTGDHEKQVAALTECNHINEALKKAVGENHFSHI